MPNFLSALSGVGNAITRGGGFNFGSLVSSASSLSPVGLGGIGRGTKPRALHTEYAAEDANWSKPYSMGTDIVFYLQRADQTSNISDTTNNFGGDLSKGAIGGFNGQANTLTTTALGTNVGGVERSRVPANVQAGPNGFISKAQTPLSQIATASKMGGISTGNIGRYQPTSNYVNTVAGAAPTAVGFLTNFNKSANTQSNSITSQSAVTQASLAQNTVGALGSGTTTRFTPGFATSTQYWSETTNNSFNPGGIRSPFEVPTSEFSTELAFSSGGVNSSDYYRDLSVGGKINSTAPRTSGSTALAFSNILSGITSLFGGGGGSGDDIPSEWYFITAPQSISWSKESGANELNTYGSNGSYLSYGTTKLRKLTLGSALVEGFSDGKAIEDNILQLEKCMKMVINAGSGYTSPYCWNVYAGGKSYGTFLITSIKVTEAMRDMSGHATRAVVDIELQEVPAYQVSSGTDLTSRAMTAVTSDAFNAFKKKSISQAAAQNAKAAAAKGSSAAGGLAGGGALGGGSGGGGSSTSPTTTSALRPSADL